MIIESQNGKKVYSDGNQTELEMLQIAEQYPEDMSQDAISGDSRYTINNTFSSVRRNILNWYPWKKDATVCEVGAGMGAVTGLLCDKCKEVTAIEMNELRADVIRARYPQRTNLEVISEDVNYWKTDKRFDYVVFVGVLEYAAVFLKEPEPFLTFLNNCKNLLKDDGVILFAIENRFGLKYWAGASEDHLQQPFVGVGGYEPNTPRTFSKSELTELLDKAGLTEKRFYYVFPDYKFPTIISTDERQPSYNELQKTSFTYGRNSNLLFNEKNLYKDIIEDGRIDFFANSFLVESSKKPLSENHVVYASCRGESKKEFRLNTTIDSHGVVTKNAAHEFAKKHIEDILDNTEKLKKMGIEVLPYAQGSNGEICCDIFHGQSADTFFEDCLKQNDLRSIYHLVDILKQNISNSSELSLKENNILTDNGLFDAKFEYGPILKNGYIDMTFYNAFYENNHLIFYDQEWMFENVPLNFIVYYAIKSIFSRSKIKSHINLNHILEYVGIGEERVVFDKLEEYIWSIVLYRQGDTYGKDGYCNVYSDDITLHERLEREATLTIENEQLFNQLNNKLAHIELLLQSERDLNNKLNHFETEIEVFTTSVDRLSKKNELLNNDIDSLSAKNELLNNDIDSLSAKNELLNNDIDSLSAKNELLNSDIINLSKENELQKNTINNKNTHIEQLLVVNREFENLKHSRSWRVMCGLWKISETVLPHNSKRRLAAKMVLKFCKYPFAFLKKINPKRISKFFYYLKREGVSGVSKRLDECVRGTKVPPQEIIVTAVKIIPEVILSAENFSPLNVPCFEKIKVSIVIPVYNQFEYTYNCIKSILKHSENVAYEIIVADDCSNDLTKNISEIITGIHVIRNEENLRFLKNCNNAAKYAQGEHILFLNNDTQVQANWLAPLVELIESDSKIGMVGSKLIYPDGRLQEAGGIIWKDGSAWNYGHFADPSEPEYNYVKEVDYISGASIMIKKDLWEDIGGFDKRYVPAYCEDSDLTFEVRKHGFKVMYQPKSVVVHFEGISNGTDVAVGQKAYQIANSKKFTEKWKDVLNEQHFENENNVFQARDRSRNKKTLLMIDHYVPHFDKDAGSRTVYQYLQLFVQMGFNVKFIGDNFYPHEPYLTALQQLGIEVLIGPYYANHWKDWFKENANNIDFVFLNRPHISIKYIDYIKNNSKAKVIYYGHDLHFLRELREYELTGDKTLLKSSNEIKKQELELMQKSDVVYYPSYIEVEEIQKLNKNIYAKAIPAYLFNKVTRHDYNCETRSKLMFVGGFGHKPNIDGVEWLAREVIPLLKEKMPNICVHILGSNPPEHFRDYESDQLKIIGFVSDEQLAEYYKSSRMVLVPLRYGAGIKGKVVEAMYHGVPIVTTSIGAEGIIGADNFLAVTADTAAAFSDKICSLYDDEIKLKEMSRQSYDYVENVFSPQNAIKVIGDDFI